jgi:thymidylate kinase/thymidylate synthase ThyX
MKQPSSDSEIGQFIVIEGTDGSGKGTQFKLLTDKLQAQGYDVVTFDFPQYDQPSSYFVREYLNGKYGTSDEVGPYTGSLFYALDRYQAAPAIREALAAGKIVLANRFTGSNMGHQGTKFSHAEERRGYFIWLDNLEFQMLGIPRPNKSFVLRVPAETAQKLVDKKVTREYTDKRRDIHEADMEHLKRAVDVYDDMCDLFPKDFQRIDCVRNGELLSIDTVHDLLWKMIEPSLPQKHTSMSGSVKPLNVTNLYVEKTSNGYEITASGKAFLADAVSSVDDDVYVFNDKLSATTIAAAMARLSRRGDDMRVTLLDEFAATLGKDDKLLQRVITAYGDDSVQQLVGLHLVVENASNLLTKKLEWGRLAAYLEQSTRYIYFDQKDSKGKYRYYTPSTFDSDTKELYEEAMDTLFDLYSSMVRQLTEYVRHTSDVPENERDVAWQGATRAQACDAIRAVLPVATKSTVGIYASGQAVENLIMNLLADDLPEAREVGKSLLTHARTIIPTFLERADKPERGGATIAYRSNTRKNVATLAAELLSENHTTDLEAVTLTSYWPRNELDLVPDVLYEHSSLSRKEIEEETAKLPYETKEKVLKTFIGERLNRRHKPGRALEKAHYSWDIVCDYGIFRDLQRHRIVDDLNWQHLTPRYGYEIPKLVEEAGMAEIFEQCFDLSLKLHSMLQSKGYTLEAQYATLLGHKMRWKITYNAREAFHFHELRTSPQGHPGYRKLVLEMHEKLATVHPLLADAMIFVNAAEDDKLTRLAAERYTQYKLENLQ